MELTNKQILEFLNGTAPMLSKKLPLKLAFAMKHNRAEAVRKLKAFEESREDILTRLPSGKERDAEFNKLLDETVEVDVKMVSVEAVELTENEGYDHLTLGELEAIDFMME